MRLVSVTAGLFLLLSGGQLGAAPQLEYLAIAPADAAAGIPSGKLAWELRDSLSKRFNYRIAGNDQAGFRFRDEEWVVHNLTSDAHSVSTLLDWHPLDGHFRFSAGLFSYKQSLDYSIAPDVDTVFEYELRYDRERAANRIARELREEGIQVKADDLKSYLPKSRVVKIRKHIEFNAQDLSIHARIKYENLAPYLGFGWSTPFSKYSRLRYSLDIGVMYQVEPDIQLGIQGDVLDGAKPAVRTWLDEWTFEQTLKLGGKLEEYNPTPRIGFGLSYKLY